jgi:demethylmenaquinone methyltransferase/2-methoxy-6-polyprenyl-1,4-benzoquinol methylase
MSLGLHRLWKRYFVSTAGVRRLTGARFWWHRRHRSLLAPLVGDSGLVVLSDINAQMRKRGRDRMLDAGHSSRIVTARINAEAPPFPTAADCITIAFGSNATDRAARRVEMRAAPGAVARWC